MPLSIIFIQRACLIKDKYGNVKLNKRGEILALQRARLIAGASQKLTKLKEEKKDEGTVLCKMLQHFF